MELLIPGLVLVALMVYVSTRIKRSAAAAYDAETIETGYFSVRKPDGFLAIADPEPPLLFEAHSKEFGEGERQDEHLISATVRFADGNIQTASESIRRGLLSETSHWHIGQDQLIEGRDSASFVTYRISDLGGKCAVLSVHSIVEPEGETKRKIDGLIESFEVKAAAASV